MAVFAYASVFDEAEPLSRHAADYLAGAAEKGASDRRAALLLMQRLATQTGICVEFPILKEEQGKPFLDGENAPDFNLSHSGGAVACILGRGRVGIDVQEESEALDVERLAARFFEEGERARLQNASRESFFELWTKKEALGKCLGEGLAPFLKKDPDATARELGLHLVSRRFVLHGRAYALSACASERIEWIEL